MTNTKTNAPKYTIALDALDDEARDLFIEGWELEGGYTADCQDGNPAPWCCPWEYASEIEVEGTNAKEWGASYWRQVRPEVEALLAADAAD